MQSGAAQVFAGCYETYAADQNFAALAGWLDRHGFTTEDGLPWSAETVRQVMDRGFAAGLLQIHDPECMCGRASRCQHKVFQSGGHTPHISDVPWKQYVKLRDAKVTRPSHSMHQFTGFIGCWHCGGGMHLIRYQKGFLCSSRARHDEMVCGSRFALLKAVEDALLQLLAEWAPEIEASAYDDTALLEEQRRIVAERLANPVLWRPVHDYIRENRSRAGTQAGSRGRGVGRQYRTHP
ncbi:hypothetical protein ABZ912_32140 [Nonomuraea angiospora]|uniref:recombinase family protein n=1 Tax=Nonomuraea angiospora TaxID=46172 RepID=UPI0033E5A611